MEILIIKLGAKGDIVRTLPIALALKKKYPDSKISWLAKNSNKELIENSPYVDSVFVLPYVRNAKGISEHPKIPNKTQKFFDEEVRKFDVLYNFDIDEEATSLADRIQAGKKYGFFSQDGFASAFNLGAEYYLNTLFDDETKKTNKKTYQEMMFMAAELPYKKEHHPIALKEEDKKYAEDFARKNNLKAENLIGIHIGSSPRWPSKFWPAGKIKEFILKAREKGYQILLFAGPDDADKQKEIVSELEQKQVQVYFNDSRNKDLEFASLVNLCKFVVCGDSFALHVSLALKKKTVALFFCTSPEEVEGYGCLKKIVSPRLPDFFPEKQDAYSEELVNSISAEEVLKAIKSFE
ncbi:hypothetical protein A3K73_01800 [Candidatus Pacearchaeota archaeon RBG_13_36_9]|nr:MAG: hypothetical protein A3K73_01800 [Candidatus Pacearchaeota archaeon RBG_13_36_9]